MKTTASLKRKIAAWIRHAVDVRPTIMRGVAKRELGNLHNWIDKLENGRYCGCLIGTTALVVGAKPAWALDGDTELPNGGFIETACAVVSTKINKTYTPERTQEVGIAVSNLASLMDPRPCWSAFDTDQPNTKKWIKDTINRALARRRARVRK